MEITRYCHWDTIPHHHWEYKFHPMLLLKFKNGSESIVSLNPPCFAQPINFFLPTFRAEKVNHVFQKALGGCQTQSCLAGDWYM